MSMDAFSFLMPDVWLSQTPPMSKSVIAAFMFQSTLFLGLVFGAARLLRTYDASVRNLLWICAIALTPLLTIISNQTPSSQLNHYVEKFISFQLLDLREASPAVSADEQKRDSVGATTIIAAIKGNEAISSKALPLWRYAIGFYYLVALVLLARLPLGWMRLAHLRRSAVELNDRREIGLLSDVVRITEYKGTCQLRWTREIESPLSFGIWKPLVLLPTSYGDELSETELRAILLHEITHIHHRDPLKALFCKLIESILWFQPLIWLASYKAQYLSELAADDAVLKAGISADTYANVIVNLVEIGSAPKHSLQLATGIFSAPKMLISRIEYLLDGSRSHETRIRGGRVVAACLALVSALVVSLQLTPRSLAAGSRGAPDLKVWADLVLIPSGKFAMGATDKMKADFYGFVGSPQRMHFEEPLVEASSPVHDVYLDNFYIFKYEVTNSQYQAFVSATGHHNSSGIYNAHFNSPNQPVVNVTWNDAQAFCAWVGGRLPTEAEWEKATRGTEGFVYPWGDIWDAAKLRSGDGVAQQSFSTIEEWNLWKQQYMKNWPGDKPAEVGSFPQGASPYGVMDMAGNVWEWVADWYDASYYQHSPGSNPKGPETGDLKVLRGGAWDTATPVNYSWFRQKFMPPSGGRTVTGFRCAVDYE